MRPSMSTIHTLRRTTLALLAAVLCAVIFSACSPDDPFIPTPRKVVEKKGAWLRVIHAAPDDPAVLVRAGDSLLMEKPQHYMQFSTTLENEAKYYPVDTAAHSIKFTLGDGSVVAEKSNVQFVENEYYTVYLYGRPGNRQVLFTADSIEPAPQSDPLPVKLRIVNLANDAPAVTVRLETSTNTPLVEGLPYGQASNYLRAKNYLTGTALFVTESPSNKLLFFTPTGFILISNATFTVVISGNSHPAGDDPFLQFTAFVENAHNDDSLRGATGFPISLGAQRMVNISSSGDSLLDVTYLEERSDIKGEFEFNDFYRRTNYSASPFFVDRVPSLGHPIFPWYRLYHYEGLGINSTQKYRIEYHEEWGQKPSVVLKNGQPLDPSVYIDYRKQHAFSAQNSFAYQSNHRYTFVAYGEYEQNVSDRESGAPSGKTTVLIDNTSAPSGGMAQVRLFHGAFGELESKRLRLRVGTAVTPTAVAYGEATQGTNSVSVSAGAVTAEIIDENNNVVHSQELITDPNSHTGLEAGKSYTIFFSRGYKGDTLYLHPLSEELRLEP